MSAITLPAVTIYAYAAGQRVSSYLPIGTVAQLPWMAQVISARRPTTDYSIHRTAWQPDFSVTGGWGIREEIFSQAKGVSTPPLPQSGSWSNVYSVVNGGVGFGSGTLWLDVNSGYYRAYFDGLVAGTASGNATLTFYGGGNTYTLPIVLKLDVEPPGQPPVISPLADIAAIVGQSAYFTATATNNPTSFNATGLPPGIVRVADRVIYDAASGATWAGTPYSAGTYRVTVTASNAYGTSQRVTFIWTVTAATDRRPVITTSPGAATATVGASFMLAFTATNSPTSWAAAGLPGGLAINASGTITGTPTTAGTYLVTVTASNAYGTSDPVTPTITVATMPVPVIVPVAPIQRAVGYYVDIIVQASNSPTSFTAAGLPRDLSFYSSSYGQISGTAVLAGTFTITLTASNAGGASAPFTFTITVIDPNGRSWWQAKAGGKVRRSGWSGKFVELRNRIWWLVNFTAASGATTSEAPVQSADFTAEEFTALDWVTSGIPSTATGNNWRWARLAAIAGAKVRRASWSRRYLERIPGGIWYAVWTGATGGVTTRRVAIAGDMAPEDFRARDWAADGGTGLPPADDSTAIP